MRVSGWRDDIAFGTTLLTRLPAGWVGDAGQSTLARSIWTWPIVGAVCGLLSGVFMDVLRHAGLPAGIAAFWLVGFQLLLTGALHEDGLADCADGFGGGTTREKVLSIMRDSRIGSYGALALMIVIGARISAVAMLSDDVIGALCAAGALSRGGMAWMATTLPAARQDGLASTLVPEWAAARVPMIISAIICCSALATGYGLFAAAASMIAVMLATGVFRSYVRKRLGGHTGDILGATACLSEAVVLSVIAAVSETM